MGLTDMKQSNQATNGDTTTYFLKGNNISNAKIAPLVKDSSGVANNSALSNDLWSNDGLMAGGSRLFQRSSSTPPTHVDMLNGSQRHQQDRKSNVKYTLGHFALGETVEENNQDEEVPELGRHDLMMPTGKHPQRSWSAPPVPDNFDAFFAKQSDDTLPAIVESNRRQWSGGDCGSIKSVEKTSISTTSPLDSPLMADGRSDMRQLMHAPRNASSFPHGRIAPNPQFLTLVDRVQEDFPRTPSPVFGYSAASVVPSHIADQMMAGAMKQLRIDDASQVAPAAFDARPTARRGDHSYGPAVFNARASEFRPPHRVHNQPGFVSPYPVVAPPGFQAPARGIYANPLGHDPRAAWAPETHARFSGNHFPVNPASYDQVPYPPRGSFKEDFYPNKYGGNNGYDHFDAPGRGFQAPAPMRFDMPDHHMYNAPQPGPMYRSKSGGPSRYHEHTVHPAHSYGAASLLEEFKAAPKSDKWDLRSIQGHLAQFARDQAGSRFIQLKLEKADDHVREEVFNELYPHALQLMADLFGNYVIQKFFDHGSLEHQRRLVSLMKKNMVTLALQVYGCRVIQKALEVTQVDEQLALIREMRGHVMKCVVDQNGNHVLQKCIEAASTKKAMNCPSSQRQVSGADIQFIVDDFVGHAAVLSMHAYGCRVIQRVLEHCSPQQIRPIINEIMFKCRDLIKDQYGNYVVQHVICHGDIDQRNTLMQAIVPDIAKWSEHKYASNVVEACLDGATKDEIHEIVELVLDCDESGSCCAFLPMMKHMYGNYVVQKLLDRADRHDRPRLDRIIVHNADYLKRFTYGRHVLSRLEREGHNGNKHLY